MIPVTSVLHRLSIIMLDQRGRRPTDNADTVADHHFPVSPTTVRYAPPEFAGQTAFGFPGVGSQCRDSALRGRWCKAARHRSPGCKWSRQQRRLTLLPHACLVLPCMLGTPGGSRRSRSHLNLTQDAIDFAEAQDVHPPPYGCHTTPPPLPL